MTVVIALKLNDEKVMGIADKMITLGRDATNDLGVKMGRYGEGHFYGFAGAPEFSDLVMRKAETEITEGMTTHERADVIYKHSMDVIENYRQEVFDYHKVTAEDYRQGKLPDAFRNEIKNNLNNTERGFSTEFLVGGIDPVSQKSDLFKVPFLGKSGPRRKYDVIGNGKRDAEPIIARYLENLDVKKLEDIPDAEGCESIMRAARYAWRVPGVGGRTKVVMVKKGEKDLWELGDDESNLLQNVIYMGEMGKLKNRYVKGIFKDVVEGGAKGADIINTLKDYITTDDIFKYFFLYGLHR